MCVNTSPASLCRLSVVFRVTKTGSVEPFVVCGSTHFIATVSSKFLVTLLG